MTTTQRVWYEGAAYHITASDNHRNDIFSDEMDNHVHLMIKELRKKNQKNMEIPYT